jgi:hypothetical protein
MMQESHPDHTLESVASLDLERDSFMTVMSQRKSGKSVLIASLIHYFMEGSPAKQRCDYAYLFSATAALNQTTNHSYSFFDKKAILKPSPENMSNFISNLIKSQTQTKMKYHVLLVFDDIVVTQRYEVLEWLASAGRHYSITVILSSQISNNAVSPTIRANVDYIFWRKLGKAAIQNNIFPFMSISEFADYKELNQYTLQHTNDYQFIFYNNSTDTSDEKIKVVKAFPIPEDYRYIVKGPSAKSLKRQKRANMVIKW